MKIIVIMIDGRISRNIEVSQTADHSFNQKYKVKR